ncbi:MFS transporter, SP family, sugar:H+ symporter [Galdieria sulphuraria]|uniref:MFS transporter, SP family, sugar:H+ symporter n=1 Tax=Galdieria sulphuraria TaxID=130081 RepID=M2VZF1_GALSU|nr:MFS transporter, SP family, sugar:H+ symporter [Galdieria sulphuraria]EME28711.1 MFS transporter, SP family, sugar:H+ symporter [Galdieria sulphuraria]|eukprot:XP_005705231.1 MFS transporter, SP family, sugar:H+ symporter [Galdieria sulphuraria]
MSGIELQEDADVQKTQDTEIVYNNREKQDYVTQLEASLDEEEVKKELEILKEESLKFTGFSFRTHTLFKKGGRHMTLILGIFASIGGFIFGMDQGVISGALLFMPKDLSLTSGEESMVTGFMPLGAVLGATIAYPLNEWLGRKISIIIACLFYSVGGILQADAHNFGMILSGRIILGVGLGLECTACPVYISESCTKRWRGGLVSLYQFMICFGLFCAYIVAAIFVNVPGNWRYMLGSTLVFSSILLIAMCTMPETPRWLMRKGREAQSYRVWRIVRGFDTEEERNEFYIMKKTVERELRNSKDRWIIMDLIRVHRCRHAAIFGAIIAILEQFSGINSINYYMSTLMHEVGFSRVHAVYSSMIGSGTLLLFTIPAIYLMDRMGRRALWLSLLPGVVIGCFIIGFSFRASNIHIEEGIYIWGIITYYMFWGSGMGPYTWVIGSEIFPTYIRSEGMALVTWWTYIGNFLTTYLFTRMKTAMTGPGIFIGFYGGFVVLSWFYGLLMMPETKDKTLEEIDALFSMSMPALAKHNWNNAKKTTNDLLHFRLKEVWKIE